jgi:hypothetical protein
MSKRLEDFINENREQFDSEEPSPQIWKNIEKGFIPNQKKTPAKKIQFQRWVAAAAVIAAVLAGSYAIFLAQPAKDFAGQTNPSFNHILDEINPTYAKEVYHFTQLIELKQDELRQIGKDQPALYRQFMSDITLLDSSYNSLKKELPANPNREQLLEAMIQNLQLQTELLNQQLRVIKQIKQSKTSSNESNSKSI